MFCLNCQSFFNDSEVDKIKQYNEFWGTSCSEIFHCCPYCGSEDIIDTKPFKCDCCDEYCTSDFIETADGHHYCYNCYHINNY